jgi:hypothetical protein
LLGWQLALRILLWLKGFQNARFKEQKDVYRQGIRVKKLNILNHRRCIYFGSFVFWMNVQGDRFWISNFSLRWRYRVLGLTCLKHGLMVNMMKNIGKFSTNSSLASITQEWLCLNSYFQLGKLGNQNWGKKWVPLQKL